MKTLIFFCMCSGMPKLKHTSLLRLTLFFSCCGSWTLTSIVPLQQRRPVLSWAALAGVVCRSREGILPPYWELVRPYLESPGLGSPVKKRHGHTVESPAKALKIIRGLECLRKAERIDIVQPGEKKAHGEFYQCAQIREGRLQRKQPGSFPWYPMTQTELCSEPWTKTGNPLWTLRVFPPLPPQLWGWQAKFMQRHCGVEYLYMQIFKSCLDMVMSNLPSLALLGHEGWTSEAQRSL